MKQAPIQKLKQALAEGMNVHSEFGTRGVPLIVIAARYGAAEALEVLLEAGADLSEQDNDGNTAYMVAKDPEVIAIIVATQAAECVVNEVKVPTTRAVRETL